MMKTLLLLLFFVLDTLIALSQNDTIYLYNDSILLNGVVFNKVVNGKKQGIWIEYSTSQLVITTQGDDDSYPYEIFYRYSSIDKAYQYNEYDSIVKTSIIGTDTIQVMEYVRYLNTIAPDFYKLIGKGIYFDDKKYGFWTYYHENGALKSEIEYSESIPINDYKIYDLDGKIKYTLKKHGLKEWEICKFDEREKLISCEDMDIMKIDFLY